MTGHDYRQTIYGSDSAQPKKTRCFAGVRADEIFDTLVSAESTGGITREEAINAMSALAGLCNLLECSWPPRLSQYTAMLGREGRDA